jgi:hypothetical protein
MIKHWLEFRHEDLTDSSSVPLFGGFVDCVALRGSFLERLIGDLTLLQDVWHELAIPTAVVHNTAKIGLLHGTALWGTDRHQSLQELLSYLQRGDFVHPVKLSRYLTAEVCEVYQRLVPTGGSRQQERRL